MFSITCIISNENQESVFRSMEFDKIERGGMLLSEQIAAKNFRLRESKPGYESTWHLAGDPTLIIIQKGTLRIYLHNGEFKDFAASDMFIAADNLPIGLVFDPIKHGHKAKVIGDETLFAVHIKLEDFVFE